MRKPARCLEGSLVALPTPFGATSIDHDAFRHLIELQAAGGSDGIVVAGTTGEGSAISDAERRGLFEVAVSAARGRMQVIANVGTADTRSSLQLARAAMHAGADAVMAVVPPYCLPPDRALVAHFSAIAQVVPGVPVMLYDVPKRTGRDLPLEVARAVAREHRNVQAIKLATCDLERVREFVTGSGLDVFCGEDRRIREMLGCGAVGTVSVVGNVLPAETAALVRASRRDADGVRAQALAARLAPVLQALSLDTNPIPVKAALAVLHGVPAAVRLPLLEMEPGEAALLGEALAAAVAQRPAMDPAESRAAVLESGQG